MLRAQGKTDLVNGGLLVGLGMGYSVEKAMGMATFGWLFSIVLVDLFFREYASMGKPLKSVSIQFLIALGASTTMYFSTYRME